MEYKLIATKRHEKTTKKFHYCGFLCLFVAIRFFGLVVYPGDLAVSMSNRTRQP